MSFRISQRNANRFDRELLASRSVPLESLGQVMEKFEKKDAKTRLHGQKR